MALPIVDPKRTFYSQRVDGKPFVNCLPYSICPVLAFMGYDVPKDFGMTLRKASGVPMAEHRGTSYADMKRALRKELPDAPVTFEAISDSALVNLLAGAQKPNKAGKAVISVTARMQDLPRNLRRHVGYDWKGLHALTFHGRKKAPDGTWLLYLTDPMGRTFRGYEGEWVRQSDVSPALKRNDLGLIHCAYGKRGSAA
jgi:pimeloyl-ACP methyl ester carboxylesterase